MCGLLSGPGGPVTIYNAVGISGCEPPQPTSLTRPTPRCPAMSGRSTDRDRFATAMLDASGLQRSAVRRRRLQTHSSELLDFFGDLMARPRLLICGLGFDSPPAHHFTVVDLVPTLQARRNRHRWQRAIAAYSSTIFRCAILDTADSHLRVEEDSSFSARRTL